MTEHTQSEHEDAVVRASSSRRNSGDGSSSSQSRSGARMIACLLRDAQEDFDVHVDILNRALRGVLRSAGDDGRWAVDASGNRFVYLSHEPPGLQVSFEETTDRERAERVVAEIIASLEAVTDKIFHAVWIS